MSATVICYSKQLLLPRCEGLGTWDKTASSVGIKPAMTDFYYVKESRGRGLRATSGLNCELYRRCLSSTTGSVVTAAPPCILVISCSARCLSCCSRRIRSARNSSILLLFACFSHSFLCRWWLWWMPCTVSKKKQTVTIDMHVSILWLLVLPCSAVDPTDIITSQDAPTIVPLVHCISTPHTHTRKGMSGSACKPTEIKTVRNKGVSRTHKRGLPAVYGHFGIKTLRHRSQR